MRQRDGSQRSGASCAGLGEGLACKIIEFACLGICLNLIVPLLGAEFRKPIAQFFDFFRGEPGDLFFQRLHAGHGVTFGFRQLPGMFYRASV